MSSTTGGGAGRGRGGGTSGGQADCLMGVDIGTQGTKAVVVRRDGRILATSYVGYDVDQPRPLWAEQWPDVWLNATHQAMRQALADSGVAPASIAGVGISSLYGGSGIPVDEHLQPLAPCLIWMDRRASAEVQWVREHVDLDWLYAITANTVDSYYGFTKILWFRNHEPDVWRKTQLFLPPNAYVIQRLTGEIAVDHTSAGNLGGVYDIHRHTWSEATCEALGIPVRMMPRRLVASQDVVGYLNAAGARQTGLLAGTPIVAGGIDAPVATLSAGAFRPGNHVAMVGTSMCWGFITEQTNLTPALISYPHAVDPLHKVYTFGGAATAGAVLRWFRDVLGQPEKEAAQRLPGVEAYSLLELESMRVPAGSDGLLVLPYFMGERSPIWDANARGTILGLSLYHTKAHLYRAFMEGVAFALRHNIESAQAAVRGAVRGAVREGVRGAGQAQGQAAGQTPGQVSGQTPGQTPGQASGQVSGQTPGQAPGQAAQAEQAQLQLDPVMTLVGGAAKSMVWPQIFADVTGFAVRTVQPDVEAPLGDALLAGLGTGLVDQPARLLDWLTYLPPVQPRDAVRELYDERFREYQALYESLRLNMARLYGQSGGGNGDAGRER